MTFKTIIRRLMKNKKLSANDVAKLTRVTRRNVMYWRSGRHEPPEGKKEGIINTIQGA